jgi:hypothetical protein
VLVATKAGLVRSGKEQCRPDTDPSRLLAAIKRSHAALNGQGNKQPQPIALWQLHVFEEKRVPLERTLDAARAAVSSGLVRAVGLCNVSLKQLLAAEACLAQDGIAVASVQNHFSPWDRKVERDGVLAHCAAQGIAFLPHGALGGSRARSGRFDLLQDFPQVRCGAVRCGACLFAHPIDPPSSPIAPPSSPIAPPHRFPGQRRPPPPPPRRVPAALSGSWLRMPRSWARLRTSSCWPGC